MPSSDLQIKGAREHNLRSINVTLPRNQLICLTGVSGSGKSSLAFDTVFAEGQRRYVESLSSFARQFLGQMPKPEVDSIEGLSPTISISQKTAGRNPRSTVGTITEIYDYLRVLYARVGQGHCPQCNRPVTAQTREQIIAQILSFEEGTPIAVLAPLIRGQKGEFRDLFDDLLRQGFSRARIDGRIASLSEEQSLDRQMRHNIEVVIDRLKITRRQRARLAEAVELALSVGKGNLIVVADSDARANSRTSTADAKRGTTHRSETSGAELQLSSEFACTHCRVSFEPLSPQLFSFNSPQGMCKACDGLGEFFSFDPLLLVPKPDRSIQQGGIELIGRLKAMGRWKRHVYKGVAETVERLHDLPPGTMLETAWEELGKELQNLWLWGTGDEHITYTWRSGQRGMKHGGKFEGIIPELLSKYRNSRSTPQIRKLEKYMNTIRCPDCQGQRLNPQARAVRIATADPQFSKNPAHTLPELCQLPVSDATQFFSKLLLTETQQTIAEELVKEIRGRLGFLENVGLDYLSLNRSAPTLSGGESQRIRLAGQIGCGLVGVLYILDEPSIGLHTRDNNRLLDTLNQLRDLGNTVVVVEHDEDTMRAADHVIDFGPGPGVRGGELVAQGDWKAIAGEKRSITGQYLAGTMEIEIPKKRRTADERKIRVLGATHNNLKNVDVEIPLGMLVCVTGVSGSGKSSLVSDILVESLRRDLNGGKGDPGAHHSIEGLAYLDKLIAIDQSPIGRTPRSNPATYIKVFDEIRKLYALLPDAKRRGYSAGRFSFNVRGGRCEGCEGCGANKLEMDFLAAIWVPCPICGAKRFNQETLEIRYKGKSIADVLEMDIQQALLHFENIPKIHDKLQTLHDVGLDYIKLGQPSPTLSGGEAQRIKLARELVKRSTGKTLYLLDEPTTGLHFADIKILLSVLDNFVAAGNTVLVVEHNLDVIKTADWVIDLGPEGGAAGGQIVVAGTPEAIARHPDSHTGRSLKRFFSKRDTASTPEKPRRKRRSVPQEIRVRGARQHNLKGIDVRIPRDAMTVCCGVSGSGKTSLAMDTIYAEGQRRYVESLSSYARQFVAQMQKPLLDQIEGLSPSIAIEQRHMGHTPRSTVGTVTEIYDYLRILIARIGTPHCPACDIVIGTQTADEIIERIVAQPSGTQLYLLAPLAISVGEKYEALWDQVRSRGYVRVRIDGQTYSIDETPEIDRRRKHTVEVVVDRVTLRGNTRSRVAESVEAALGIGEGTISVAVVDQQRDEERWEVETHSQHFACDQCGRSFEPLGPHHFSFNSPLGWCESCEGLGTETGTNLTALLRDGKLSLRQGAVAIWPAVDQQISQWMLDALANQLDLPVDLPFDELPHAARRAVLYGTGETWLDVRPDRKQIKTTPPPLFRFQYKGLYPALDEAARLSARFRGRMEHLLSEVECSQCSGSRLRDDASAVQFREKTIAGYCRLPLGTLREEMQGWKLDSREMKIAGELVREITNRVEFLCNVGLEYLSLARPAPSLSGGESQRIRLASQVGSGLCGVLYVLDEPTIGLHPRDNRRLLAALRQLRDLGNTLLLVEHDREVLAAADHLLDFGPGAGRHGGTIVAQGTATALGRKRGSITGPYLSGKKAIPIPTNRRTLTTNHSTHQKKKGDLKKSPATKHSVRKPAIPLSEQIEIRGARHNNLQNLDVAIPLGTLTAVTGVSGSGKSSLINDILYNALARRLHRAQTNPAPHDDIRGIEHINKVIRADQRPLGNSPTSNPATYTGLFDLIRTLFSQLPEAKVRGYTARRFSFNAAGGRCDDCDGNGQLAIEMHFLPDIWVECDTCHGKRYNPETLSVEYHGCNIADVLEMPCEDALQLFDKIPKIRRILNTLCDVGLGYLQLGQAAPTLSGGEAQRVKLAAELSRPDTGQTLYLLDEPTTGLHFEDLRKLLEVLHRLVDLGNSVVVIEHNLDVIKSADWVIDLGPEAGSDGGQVVTWGTPEQVARYGEKAVKNKRLPRSHTGEVLAPVLEAGPYKKRKVYNFAAEAKAQSGDIDISDVGKNQKMPWEIDGHRWHTKTRVARSGEPCNWDGKVVDRVVEYIERAGGFRDTDWNNRGVVEIAAPKKTHGWFFHAMTSEPWLVKLKFRTASRTFQHDTLVEQVGMTPLNDMHDLPIYGTDQRVRCKNLRGPWQEVELQVFSMREIDHPEFWEMLDRAIAGFKKIADKKEQHPEDVMPWKVLGEKWHFSSKGFPLGRKRDWPPMLLEQLHQLLEKTAPEGNFIWNNQQVVHLFVPGQKEPWATLHTKRPQALELSIIGPSGQFTLGRIARLGNSRQLSAGSLDTFKFRFSNGEGLQKTDPEHGDLVTFLKEHLAQITPTTTAV